MMPASSTASRWSSHDYSLVEAVEQPTVSEERPTNGTGQRLLFALLLANGLLCAALSGVLLYCAAVAVSTRWSHIESTVTTTSVVLPSSPSSLSDRTDTVDRTLLSLGLPVSGSLLLSSRTSLLTVVLMNRTGTHFAQPEQQGTFVNTNLDHAATLTPPLFHAALHDYYHSVCQRRLNAIVLHDIEPSHAADYYSQYEQQPYSFLGQRYVCNVTFVYAVHLIAPQLYDNLHPYDVRWMLYHRYLQLHGAHYEWVLFSDVSDVTFEHHPFDFMVRQWVDDGQHPTLFVGRDPYILQQHEFCKQRFAACALEYESFGHRMAVNAGVLGGAVEQCQWLLASLARFYDHLLLNATLSASLQCRQLGADMAVLNKLFLDPSLVDEPLLARPRPLPFNWYAEESGLVGGAFTGPFAFERSVPGRQIIRHKTAWAGQQPQEWEHHLKRQQNTRDNCPLLAE